MIKEYGLDTFRLYNSYAQLLILVRKMTKRSDLVSKLKKAELISIGGPVTDSKVSLVLYSNNIDIEEITKLIGCTPSEAHRVGDIVGKRRPARIGLWSLNSPRNLSFEQQIQHLIDNTTDKRRIWNRLNEKYDIQLRCAIFMISWNEDFDLHPQLVEEIARRHWKFGISLYSAGGDEIIESFLKLEKR